jgi:chemotaxis protein methyltransferase CheR
MNVGDFEMISRLLKERSGLLLTQDKDYLLARRLNRVARRYNFKGFDELAQAVRLRDDENLLRDITDAMTTNESSFFRDAEPFDQFRDLILPQMLEHRSSQRAFRVWCAACSSGQEPYSLAMILKENESHFAGWNVEILATDISREILAQAVEGAYSQFEIQRGLPIKLLVKYFKQQDDRWKIDGPIRRMVTFKPHNLMDDLSSIGQCDVVFCRNVLIDFDQPTKAAVLAKIAKLMPGDGFLYLGGAETVIGVSDCFQHIPGLHGVFGLAASAGSHLDQAAC